MCTFPIFYLDFIVGRLLLHRPVEQGGAHRGLGRRSALVHGQGSHLLPESGTGRGSSRPGPQARPDMVVERAVGTPGAHRLTVGGLPPPFRRVGDTRVGDKAIETNNKKEGLITVLWLSLSDVLGLLKCEKIFCGNLLRDGFGNFLAIRSFQ